jgi:hypothetical protein
LAADDMEGRALPQELIRLRTLLSQNLKKIGCKPLIDKDYKQAFFMTVQKNQQL